MARNICGTPPHHHRGHRDRLHHVLMMWYDGLMRASNSPLRHAIKVLGATPVPRFGLPVQGEQTPPAAAPGRWSGGGESRPGPAAGLVGASLRLVTKRAGSSAEGAYAVSIVGMQPEQELPVNLVWPSTSRPGATSPPRTRDVVFIGNGLAEAMNIQVGETASPWSGARPPAECAACTMTVAGIYDVWHGGY